MSTAEVPLLSVRGLEVRFGAHAPAVCGLDLTVRPGQTVTVVGDTPMQSIIARLSATPGELRWEGRTLDADGDEIRNKGWGD